MNENIDLTKILKNCPKGWKFYSSLHGELLFSWMYVSSSASHITFIKPGSTSMVDGTPITVNYYCDGRYYPNQGECTIFPSKDQRDWSKFTAPWYKNEKKEKFNLSTLKPFSHVLVRDDYLQDWEGEIFTRYDEGSSFSCIGLCSSFAQCIPYNDETKHLLGTDNEAPEYYRYWED